MGIFDISLRVIPVFAIISIGWLYGKFRRLPTQELTDLLMWIFIPCLVLGSLGTERLALSELWQIGAGALFVLLGTGLLAYVLFFKRSERRALVLGTVFMNSANMAFPIALFVFGQAGYVRQVLFYIVVHLVHITVGLAFAGGRNGIKEPFRYPLVYCALVALVLAFTGTSIPEPIAQPLDLVGKATIPIMLLLLGNRLGAIRMTHLGLATLASLVRMAGGFGLGWLVAYWLKLGHEARCAVLVGSTMPSAVLNYVFSEKYNLESPLVASIVVVSTLLSIFTIPLALYLMML